MSKRYFPQLATGSLSQFPTRKEIHHRTIVNRTVGGHGVKMADPEAAAIHWNLGYSGLTDSEIESFEKLFAECEGQLRPFVFLDPLGNLLRWTENLAESVWQTNLQVVGEGEDPVGGTASWRATNAAQGGQGISQTVDAPGWYHYTFSVWVRSASTQAVSLSLANADGAISVTRPVSPEWERISVSGQITGEANEIRCALELPGGSAVDIYGPQLEAQTDCSGYRRVLDRGGVHVARFDQDALERITHGPDNHATHIRVVTVREAIT